MDVIAYIHSPFPDKFGIPRQSGLVPDIRATITFCEPYNDPNAVRGLDAFSHLWLIWGFDVPPREGTGFHPTVRPPRLGGEERLGVFATRSPFRPNALGLSCVKLEEVRFTNTGPVLYVSGADLRDGTPIYDIKPYIPQCDCIPDARGGFTDARPWQRLNVIIPDDLTSALSEEDLHGLRGALAEDPRPAYQHDRRDYHMSYAGHTVVFHVDDTANTLMVDTIEALEELSSQPPLSPRSGITHPMR